MNTEPCLLTEASVSGSEREGRKEGRKVGKRRKTASDRVGGVQEEGEKERERERARTR